MDEAKLKPFEKLLQTLEGKLMEGQIFKVSSIVFCFFCTMKFEFYHGCSCEIAHEKSFVESVMSMKKRMKMK